MKTLLSWGRLSVLWFYVDLSDWGFSRACGALYLDLGHLTIKWSYA